jgi:hypothetical protein
MLTYLGNTHVREERLAYSRNTRTAIFNAYAPAVPNFSSVSTTRFLEGSNK